MRSLKALLSMNRMGGLLFGVAVGVARLLSYWVAELCLRHWQVDEHIADLIHSTVSFSLFCAVGWYLWQYYWQGYTRRAVQRALEDQVRNGLQIVRYLEALEPDPGKRAALRAVDVKFEGSIPPPVHKA
jgi:hypothetical protein